MKRHYVFVILILWGAAALLPVSCTKPVGPGRDEPDTVKSFVRATITAPGMTNQLWEVHYPDTVSNGEVGFTQYDGTQGTRHEKAVVSLIESLQNLNPNNQNISLTIWYPHDVKIQQVVASGNSDNYIDSLRTWQEERLEFLFVAPPTITVPYTPTKLRAFRWQSFGWAEQFVPALGGTNHPASTYSGHWFIQALPYKNYEVSYNSTSNLTLYQSTIQEATLTIDRYDLDKKRISGRFSFRVVGSIHGEVIEIKNGVFENVFLSTANI